MAFRVTLRNFPGVIRVISAPARRAKVMPRRYRRWTRLGTKLGTIHHRGGRQKVVSNAQRRAIAAKVGPDQRIPRVGTVMIHPRRPVHARIRMARDVVRHLSKHVLHGGKRRVGPIMLKDILQQFAVGGSPSWKPGRNWGRLRARRPPLGGRAGRVARTWARGRFEELR